MDYFGGILYPLANGQTGTTANMLLHGYAAISNVSPIVEADFQTALGPNFANGGYGTFFNGAATNPYACLLYTSPSPRDRTRARMPSSA